MVRSPRLYNYSSTTFVLSRTPAGQLARSKSGSGSGGIGRIVQRFPVHDWPDVRYPPGVEHFVQPNGWHLYPGVENNALALFLLTIYLQ